MKIIWFLFLNRLWVVVGGDIEVGVECSMLLLVVGLGEREVYFERRVGGFSGKFLGIGSIELGFKV